MPIELQQIMLSAYIDWGTGAMMIQLVMASIVGAGLYFRRGIKRVLHTLSRRRTDQTDHTEHDGK